MIMVSYFIYFFKSITLHCAGTVDSNFKISIVQQIYNYKKDICKKNITVFIIHKIIRIFTYRLYTVYGFVTGVEIN